MNKLFRRKPSQFERLAALTMALVTIAVFYQLFAHYETVGQEAAVTGPGDTQTMAQDSYEIAAREPIARFRQEREASRAQQLTQLDAMLASTQLDETARRDASRQKLKLLEWMEQESTLEGVLYARGFEDVVVSVHTGSVNVVVKTEKLDKTQSAQIMDVVCRETGQTSGNVKIIPVI